MNDSKQRTLSKTKEKLVLNWTMYHYHIWKLIRNIKASKIKFKYVVGVPRGGVIPAVILSHQLGLEYTPNSVDLTRLKGKVLLCEDIVDSGRTIKGYLALHSTKKIYTCAIFKHKKSPITPDFYSDETNQWVQFPYEKE